MELFVKNFFSCWFVYPFIHLWFCARIILSIAGKVNVHYATVVIVGHIYNFWLKYGRELHLKLSGYFESNLRYFNYFSKCFIGLEIQRLHPWLTVPLGPQLKTQLTHASLPVTLLLDIVRDAKSRAQKK